MVKNTDDHDLCRKNVVEDLVRRVGNKADGRTNLRAFARHQRHRSDRRDGRLEPGEVAISVRQSVADDAKTIDVVDVLLRGDRDPKPQHRDL